MMPAVAAPRTFYQHTLTAPLVSFEEIDEQALNQCLTSWGHQIGELHRPDTGTYHALMQYGRPVAVIAANSLWPKEVGGLLRAETIELSRLCAERSGLNRAILRLWRELWLPESGFRCAISYQDEKLHTGNTYRFDGWRVLLKRQHSGMDTRSGRPGRDRTVWYWDTQWSSAR